MTNDNPFNEGSLIDLKIIKQELLGISGKISQQGDCGSLPD